MNISKQFTVGGETNRHESKMFLQNLRKLILIGLIGGIISAAAVEWFRMDAVQRHYLVQYGYSCFRAKPERSVKKAGPPLISNVESYWMPMVEKPEDRSIEYRICFAAGRNGSPLTWPDGRLVIEWHLKMVNAKAYSFLKTFIYGEREFSELLKQFGLLVLKLGSFFALLKALTWIKSGKQKMMDQLIRGTEAVSSKKLNKLIRKAKVHGGLKIGEIWMPRFTENHHALLIGGSGSGKTTALFQMLGQLRELQAKVLICDTKLDFVSTFYNPATDFIASPLDRRSVHYTLHSEGSDVQTAESIAYSLIQEDYGSSNQFFVDAAQAVLTEAILLTARSGNTSNAAFWKLITSHLTDLASQFEQTEAGAHLDAAGERTAHSVRSTLLNHVRIFKYLADPPAGVNPHSMRKWVKDGKAGFGFLCLRPRLKNIGRSLISLMLEQAALELLDMPDQDPGDFPRLFIVIDELAQLQRLPHLVGDLATLRSKGCAVVLATQGFSQLRAIYGPNDAATIANLCGHHLVFRTKESETQEWCSKLLGSAEYFQVMESLSMGETGQADRTSYNQQRKEIRSVMGGQLKTLPDRFCYLSLSGDWPISLTEIPKVPRPKNQPGFVERNDVDLSGSAQPEPSDDGDSEIF